MKVIFVLFSVYQNKFYNLLIFWAWYNAVEVEAGMRKLGCDTLPSNYFGTCGKNGINLCVEDVKKMIVKNTGKALPKGYGVRCDKCIDQAPKPGYARMHQCVCKYDC